MYVAPLKRLKTLPVLTAGARLEPFEGTADDGATEGVYTSHQGSHGRPNRGIRRRRARHSLPFIIALSVLTE